MDDPSEDNSFNVPELHGLTPEEEKASKHRILHSLSIRPSVVGVASFILIFLGLPWQSCAYVTPDSVTQECHVHWAYNVTSFFLSYDPARYLNNKIIGIVSFFAAAIIAIVYYFLFYKHLRPL